MQAIGDLMEIAKRTDRTKFRNQVLNPLLNAGLLEMTIPDKPRSSKQKYRLTEKWKAHLGKEGRTRRLGSATAGHSEAPE